MDPHAPTPQIDRMTRQLGEQVRAWRVRQGLMQKALAEQAGISDLAVRRLETGQGSTLDTLIRVLSALGKLDLLGALIEPVRVSPLEKVGRNTSDGGAKRAPYTRSS